MLVKETLEDGKEYSFNAVPIGHWRKHDELMQAGNPGDASEAVMSVILVSIQRNHPDVTLEKLEFELLTHENISAAYSAVRKATGLTQGEIQPVTN